MTPHAKKIRGKLLFQENGRRTLGMVLKDGADLVPSLKALASTHNLSSSQFTGMGGLKKIVLSSSSGATSRQRSISVAEPAEVISLTGYMALDTSGTVGVQIHLVASDHRGKVFGGRLVSAQVQSGLEIVLEESPSHLQRKIDTKTGWATLSL